MSDVSSVQSRQSGSEICLDVVRLFFSGLQSWLLVLRCNARLLVYLNLLSVGLSLGKSDVLYMSCSAVDSAFILSWNVTSTVIINILPRFGNGLNTSTVPTWQSECSKSHKRGQLVMIEVYLNTKF